MTPLLATNLATVSQLAEYQILCGKPRFNSKAPSWTNTRGLKITEESLLPSFWHLQIVRLSQLSLFWIARGERNVIAWKAWPKGAREALELPLTVLLSITIPIAAMKHTYQLRARHAQHLKHAQNHIIQAVATMRTTTVHGCHCSSDMVLRMLKVLGIPSAELVGVLQCWNWYSSLVNINRRMRNDC